MFNFKHNFNKKFFSNQGVSWRWFHKWKMESGKMKLLSFVKK